MISFFPVLDLTKHRVINLDAKNIDIATFPKVTSRILLKVKSDLVPARVIGGLRELPNIRIEEGTSFEKPLTNAEFTAWDEKQGNLREELLFARSLAEKYKILMHFFAIRSSFDEKVLFFLFTSDQNIDFREIVKALSLKFKKRIHLQRIPSKDRAKIMGGIGVCGREECCSFKNFSNRTATADALRDQGIMVWNNPKTQGFSGKFKDCYTYERSFYQKHRKYFPHLKQKVTVGDRKGKVVGLNMLSKEVRIEFEDRLIDNFLVHEVMYENKVNMPKETGFFPEKWEMDLDGKLPA